MYKISEFARMTGLSQSKIRFYEKNGLLQVHHRDENKYRYFTYNDAFRVNAFRVLLQYGFTVEKAIQMLDERQSGELFITSLEEQKRVLENQIAIMNSRMANLDKVISILSEGYEDKFEVTEMGDFLYVYASHGLDFSISNQNGETLARFSELMPISSNARIIKKEELLNKNKVINPSYTCALPASKEIYLGEYDKSKVNRLHVGQCVRFYRQMTREESAKLSSFDRLFEFLEKNNLEICNDVILLPTFLNLDGNGCDIEVLYIPIKSK